MTDAAPSWFGPGTDSGLDEDLEAIDAPTTQPRSSSSSGDSSGPDTQLFFQQERRRAERSGENSAFVRLFRAFLLARAALGVALVLALLGAGLFGASAPRWTIALVLGYAAQALSLRLFRPLQQGATVQTLSRVSSPQWWASMGLDLAVFGVLHALGQGASINYGALFVLPVLMAGVLTPRLVALATAAMATLLMLGVAGWTLLSGADVGLRMTEAGLVGAGFFAISLLANEMANRLRREQQAARGSLEYARQQAQLNRLVIDEMQEGVMVVDRRGRVRAANPAARILLAEAPQRPVRAAPFQLRGVAAWEPLVAAVEQAFAAGAWPEAGRDVTLRLANGQPRALRLRMRFTQRRASKTSEDVCVLFVEDKRQVQQRSQQERLAAMGRVSVGIAHEIRNPLAAIAQANALLAEDSTDPRAQQLMRMVASNVERLKRIVDDVMELAPGHGMAESQPVDAGELVAQACLDWARTNGLPPGPDDPLTCSVPLQPLVVRFETEHLRRVLVNLLDNALRHAERAPGCVQVALSADPRAPAERALLSVFNAGAAIPPEVERHLFEPFFSTRSRGSGLGLYICRELCERHGAGLEYRYRAAQADTPAGNEFVVRLRLHSATASPSTEPQS
ncbi:ATP-binding protein [Paucibacter sp. R3-3]|uniref:histidine kinase n=1 Tax=Roseateles agri TaxID=3098619 RepID=A0ABU5DAF7_9BURK|nr:ATP-binding protein [Paucibacter sp. R3-3]MDY0743267.1 ATP-binding protein [Paucibacter sp. R3-3]